jgi:hypothetical protein
VQTKAGANGIDQTLPQCQALPIMRAAGILPNRAHPSVQIAETLGLFRGF